MAMDNWKFKNYSSVIVIFITWLEKLQSILLLQSYEFFFREWFSLDILRLMVIYL